MITKRHVFGALVGLVALLMISVTSLTMTRQELTEEFHRTYPLAPNGRVSLENINGAVRVAVWDRAEIQVDAVKRAYTQERLAEAEIEIRSEPGDIHIKTRYPRSNNSWTDGEGRRNNPASVEYSLVLPRTARIDKIDLINGSLELEGVAGEVRASSINGRVTARELTGEVRLSTINGRLDAAFDRLADAQHITLESVNGTVYLAIPPDSSAELRASTVHGGIENTFGLPVERGRHVGRNLNGVLGAGATRIRLGNVNGSIKIRSTSDGPVAAVREREPHLGGELSVFLSEDDEEAESAARDAEQAARDREQAIRDAEQAARDAEQAARDQEQAARDIEQSIRDQEQAARDLEQAARDAESAVRDQEQAIRDAEQAARDAEQAMRDAEQALRDQEQSQREVEEEMRERVQEHEEQARELEMQARERGSSVRAVEGSVRTAPQAIGAGRGKEQAAHKAAREPRRR